MNCNVMLHLLLTECAEVALCEYSDANGCMWKNTP